MTTLDLPTARFSASLTARGALMLIFGAAAVRWPSSALIAALIGGAVILAISGAYEIVLALAVRGDWPRWPVMLLDGAAGLSFALLTVRAPSVELRTEMLPIAAWLTLYGAFSGSLARVLWPARRARWILAAWSVSNLALAVAAALYPHPTRELVLYAGAAYAAVFGAVQIGAGLWLRRELPAGVVPLSTGTHAGAPRP